MWIMLRDQIEYNEFCRRGQSSRKAVMPVREYRKRPWCELSPGRLITWRGKMKLAICVVLEPTICTAVRNQFVAVRRPSASKVTQKQYIGRHLRFQTRGLWRIHQRVLLRMGSRLVPIDLRLDMQTSER